ncbi:uncharacterized protein FN964_003497 isoform 1-T1 [Alca torda]
MEAGALGKERLKQNLATHRNFALAGKTAVVLFLLKQRGGESSRNLNSLWEIKISIEKEETAAFSAKGLTELSTVQLAARLTAPLPPPKVCRTFCCSAVWCKDPVLLLKKPAASQISGFLDCSNSICKALE